MQIRIEQVLILKPPALVVFRLVNLLEFYRKTISELLPADSSFLPVLSECVSFPPFVLTASRCREKSLTKFKQVVNELMEKILIAPPVICLFRGAFSLHQTVPFDLSPPLVIREQVSLLVHMFGVTTQVLQTDLMATFESSLMPAISLEDEIASILDFAVQPLVKVLFCCVFCSGILDFFDECISF